MEPKKIIKKIDGWVSIQTTNHLLEIYGIGRFWVNCEIPICKNRGGLINSLKNGTPRSLTTVGKTSIRVIFVDRVSELNPTVEELAILMKEWFSSYTSLNISSRGYKRHCTLQKFDNNSNIVSQWNMLGCFPHMIRNNEELTELEITLGLDYCNIKTF